MAHADYKKAILAAGDTDTTVTCRSLLPRRSLRTQFTRQLVELDRSGASPEEISAFLGYRRAGVAQIAGDLTEGEAYAGSSAGLIKEILPAAKVIERLVEEYEKIIKELT